MTLDHVVPRAHGGPTHVTNLVPACELCNGLRGSEPPSAWLELYPGADRAAIAAALTEVASSRDTPRFAARLAWMELAAITRAERLPPLASRRASLRPARRAR